MAVSYPDRSMQRMDVLSSFRWSAIFAGLFAALGSQILLSSIGAAIGVSAAAVAETEGVARGLGIGAGIWMVLTPLVSMFIGGMVAVWLARPLEKGVALLHGALVWCLSLVIGAFLIGSIATSAFTGVASTAGEAAGGVAAVDPAERERLQSEVGQMQQQGGRIADTAANVGTGVAWASVLAMALSLGAALIGANVAYKKVFEPTRPGRGTERREESHIVTPADKDILPGSTRPGDEYRPTDLH